MWGSRDPLLEFWDPLIFRGLKKLEITNLAQRWTTVSTNEKNAKIRSKGVIVGSRKTLLEFSEP